MVGDPIDGAVLDQVLHWRTPWLTEVVTVITHLGDTVVAAAITAAVMLALLARGRGVDAVLVAGAMVSGFLLMSASKLVVGRARPPFPDRLVDELTDSFPSGHAMMSAILVCVLGAVLVRTRGALGPLPATLLVLWTAGIGLSRVYLAAHWLTDVLAGWLLGVAWAALWIWATARYAARRAVVS
ncbi:phosphatase PAP2 family protein [Rhodococcus sp. NPDC054953]